MPPQPTVATIRLNNIITCLNLTICTLETLASSLKSPLLTAMANTTQSLLKNMQSWQTVKKNKNECSQLMEQTYELLNAILIVHIKSDTGGELPPSVLTHIGKFTETLHKIHTFVEAQQNGSRVKKFFRQGEMSTLLNDCKAGLQQGFEFFQVPMVNHMKDIIQMQEDAEKRSTEVLAMIEALLDTTSSDRSSSVRKFYSTENQIMNVAQISGLYSGSHNSSNSISMLPSEPKIFHGRDSELSDILHLFGQGTPRIAILGAGGMGKTSLARAIIHRTEITERYNQHRFFVACDLAETQVELAALIGAHVGLKPGKDLTRPVIQYFSSSSKSLLILDNLETLWEPVESRGKIEEFLSLLTGVDHLALVITMRGAERPAKVAWTHPFLPTLKPLEQAAARQTFIDIADNTHDPEQVDKVLSLTDNMPLAISLIAHLVDSEGCSHVLSHWEEEKTSLISDGYDRTSNLDLSISLSLSSPRLNPHSKDLLSLLSMLPDGLSDVELVQSKFPIDNILGCRAALIGTALAYSDEHKQLKVLVPIREYMQRIQPPGDHLIRPLLKHFQELLEFFMEYRGTQSSSSMVARVSSNYSNIQNVLQNRLQQGHPDLVNSIYCTCYLNHFSQHTGQGAISLLQHIRNVLPYPHDHRLEAYFIMECCNSWMYSISNAESDVLEHFKEFDDPDLKCRIYNSLANYYQIKGDISSAKRFCAAAISLALSTGNNNLHSQALCNLASLEWTLGITLRLNYGLALLNVAEIDVLIGTPKDDVQRNCDRARKILDTLGDVEGVALCDIILADLYLREGDSLAAQTIYERCFKLNLGFSQITTYCLERLGDVSYWGYLDGMSSRVAISLVNSLKRNEKLGIFKALRSMGDIFLYQNDEHTATNLFTVALEGFTQMDVHRSRAECMLRLGDISMGHSDPLKAVEFWERARPLFECSSQAQQVQHINERLAGISEDVLEQHRNNLAHLAELNAPSGTIEELEEDLSDIEDLDKMDMGEEKELGLIAA
ncbi:hypothetical protein B0H13DRAFT_2408025 [Mycena leptocephala]|nr:hypothetical protein B0H13DRAFT_2408025 [Mycena leptocephala]